MLNTIADEEYEAAVKLIRSWFPGEVNRKIRLKLQKQLAEQVAMISRLDVNGFPPPWVEVGHGLSLHGSGKETIQRLNNEINRLLGLR